MVRQGTAIAALACALALAAPQGAAAQNCQVPKAWQTAAVQLGYDLDVELGLTEQHTRQLLAQPSSALPGAAVVYAGQRVTSGGYIAAAVARFGTTVVGNPPTCARATRRR